MPAGLGLALGAAMLATVLAGSLIARERHLARGLADLSPQERVVRAASFGVPGTGDALPSLDRQVRAALAPIDGSEPVQGAAVPPDAVRDEARRSGRDRRARSPGPAHVGPVPAALPADAVRSPAGGRPGAIPRVPGLRLVQVGTGTLSPVPFGRFGDRAASSGTSTGLNYGERPAPPFLVARAWRRSHASPSWRSCIAATAGSCR